MKTRTLSPFKIAGEIDVVAPWRIRLLTDRGPSGDGPSNGRNGYGYVRQYFGRSLTKSVALALAIGLALLVAGCGNSAQRQAYEKAERAEQQLTAENSVAIVAEYKRVIALQPDSDWAAKARTHIEAVEAKSKAEELHKSVFQEHGID